MKPKNITFNFKGEKIKLRVLQCNAFDKIKGLMFTNKDKAKALLFEFGKTSLSIHSFFVSFPFFAVWLDEKNNVIATKGIKPYTLRVHPNRKYSKLIEIPFNKKYSKVLDKIYRT